MTVALILVVVVMVLIYLMFTTTETVVISLSNWRYYFDELGMPADEFFDRIKDRVAQTKIPDIRFSKVTYRQEGIFSASREYFRITRNEYVMDICAAPFGKGFFVSYWLGQTNGGMLAKIPILNKLFGKDMKNKTYYQLDTEKMFLESIHSCMVKTIDEICNSKGVRGITELERKSTKYAAVESN